MTVKEAIARADVIKPNTIDSETKQKWVLAFDKQIREELGVDSFSENLFAEFPYDALYTVYIVMRICLENGELDNYNESASTFNNIWFNFRKRYI